MLIYFRVFLFLVLVSLIRPCVASSTDCSPVVIDILGSDGAVLIRSTSDATFDEDLYLFNGYSASGQSWKFDWSVPSHLVSAWSIGAAFGLRMSVAEKFQLVSELSAGAPPQTIAARLQLDLRTLDVFHMNVVYHPYGTVRAELGLAEGSAVWTRQLTVVESPLHEELVSQPFLSTPGIPFEVTWTIGAYAVTGYTVLSAHLEFFSLDGTVAHVMSCHGWTGNVTAVQPATWSGIKNLLE